MATRSRTRRSARSPPSGQVVDLTSDTDEDINSNIHQDDERDSINVIAGNPITGYHVGILKGHEWLNDEIVNAYLYTVQSCYPDVFALSSYFYPKLSKESFTDSLKRWLKPVQLANRRLVLVPINLGNTHWALVAYNVPSRTLSYYDSMMHRKTGMTVLEKCLPVFQYLHKGEPSELGECVEGGEGSDHEDDKDNRDSGTDTGDDTKDEGLAELLGKLDIGSKISLRIPEGQARQQDGSSCGVFLCKWAQFLASRTDDSQWTKPPFSQKDVTSLRHDMIDILCTFQK